MRLSRYFYQVEIDLEVDERAIENLINCARRHTDGHCRRSVVPGGFIYKAKQQIDKQPLNNKVASMRVTMHELTVLYRLLQSPIAVPEFRTQVKNILDQAYNQNQKVNALAV